MCTGSRRVSAECSVWDDELQLGQCQRTVAGRGAHALPVAARFDDRAPRLSEDSMNYSDVKI